MSVVAPPPHDELEALIREARARQRKRWLGAAGLVALAAGGALAVSSVVGGESASPQRHRPRPLTAALLPTCRSSQLHPRAYLVNVGAGNVTTGFTLTNRSGSSCRLHGWPSLRLVMPGGRVVDPRAHELRLTAESTPLRVHTVVLRPNGAASFDVGGVNQIGKAGPLSRSCSAGSRAVLVTPPGAHRSLRVPRRLTYCGHGSLLVYPVAPGRTDRQWGK